MSQADLALGGILSQANYRKLQDGSRHFCSATTEAGNSILGGMLYILVTRRLRRHVMIRPSTAFLFFLLTAELATAYRFGHPKGRKEGGKEEGRRERQKKG